MNIEPINVQRNEGLSRFAWIATFESYDGPGSPLGVGATPGDAVNDLFEMAGLTDD